MGKSSRARRRCRITNSVRPQASGYDGVIRFPLLVADPSRERDDVSPPRGGELERDGSSGRPRKAADGLAGEGGYHVPCLIGSGEVQNSSLVLPRLRGSEI